MAFPWKLHIRENGEDLELSSRFIVVDEHMPLPGFFEDVALYLFHGDIIQSTQSSIERTRVITVLMISYRICLF